jgi:DNA-binding GntR family transcriptional regulator
VDDTGEFRSKRDILVRRLREAILRGDYRVGSRLRQKELAERYGASPTPVREALRILEAQGLVRHAANQGVTVADFAGTIHQLYRLREALESLATEMAVEHTSPDRAERLRDLAMAIDTAGRTGDAAARRRAHTDFHQVLYAGCEFPALEEMIRVVWSRFPWDELLLLPGIPSGRDHLRIAELVSFGESAAAAAALREHLRSVPGYLRASVDDRAKTPDGEVKDGAGRRGSSHDADGLPGRAELEPGEA